MQPKTYRLSSLLSGFYLSKQAEGCSPKTLKDYTVNLSGHFTRWCEANDKPDPTRATPGDLKAFLAHLRTEPNGRCHKHGRATPRGIASANFKYGRYSKDLPTPLASRYEEAPADSELVALRDELALADARLSDLLQKADSGEAGRIWQA